MAEMIGTLAVSFAKKIGFKKLDNPTDETVFLSVSNSIVTSKWISRWLEKFKTLQTIFLLHDIIPITHPEFTLPNATRNHRQYVRRISAVSKMVIVNSEFTKKCIADYSSAESFPVPRISVAHLGVEKIFDRQYVDAFDVVAPSVPYFVFIATIEPRKNHLLLLHVWQRLTEKLGQNSPKLILIGRRGWENENALDFFERSPSVQEHVLECSQVSDRLLLKLLKGATASLFPSYIEGYGLPLAESLAVGTPVICSDIPPFREIAGDIPEFVDPLAGRGWLKLIMEYADPANPKRSRQIKRMEKFVPHRWSDHFRIVDPLIGQLLLNPDETNNS